MSPNFEEMYQECVQYYLAKGYDLEHVIDYLAPTQNEKILLIYECIQKEKSSQVINSNNN